MNKKYCFHLTAALHGDQIVRETAGSNPVDATSFIRVAAEHRACQTRSFDPLLPTFPRQAANKSFSRRPS